MNHLNFNSSLALLFRLRVAELRPGNRPFARLAEVLLENNVLATSFTDKTEAVASLQASLRRGSLSWDEVLDYTPLPENTSLLLLVDQFEEIFRYYQQSDKNEAKTFVEWLLASSQHSASPCVLVLLVIVPHFMACQK